MLIWIILNAYGIPTMGEILFPLKVSLPSILKKKKKDYHLHEDKQDGNSWP